MIRKNLQTLFLFYSNFLAKNKVLPKKLRHFLKICTKSAAPRQKICGPGVNLARMIPVKTLVGRLALKPPLYCTAYRTAAG